MVIFMTTYGKVVWHSTPRKPENRPYGQVIGNLTSLRDYTACDQFKCTQIFP